MAAESGKRAVKRLQPVRGTRDFLADAVRLRRRVMETIRQTYEAYGFEPLETPALEDLDVLLDKYGEEGEKLLFRVLKRGDKLREALEAVQRDPGAVRQLADLGLRYDLTVPLARVVASHRAELVFPYKRYQIQPVWRADRPAKGRFREFYQCDADVVGAGPPVPEAELLAAASDALTRLGFQEFEIRLNHRGLLQGLLEAAGVPDRQRMEAVTALDKLDKVGWDGVRAELVERGVVEPDRVASVFDVAAVPSGDNEAILRLLEDRSAASGRGAVEELSEILRLAEAAGMGARIRVDPTLARGLSYYTGPIFEIASPDLSVSLAGGGRYDDLVGGFVGQSIPACGISLGLERILEILGRQAGQARAGPLVLVCCWDEGLCQASLELARGLRARGLSVDVYPGWGKLGKQLRYASRRNIPVAAILGPDEMAAGTVALKALASGEQVTVEQTEAAATIRRLAQLDSEEGGR